MQDINVAIIQTKLEWENADANLSHFDKKLAAISKPVDLIVLPEMFNTAFSMNPSVCAEKPGGKTMIWMKEKAKEKKCIIVGSLLTEDNGKYFNRLVWMTPTGIANYYDKKHLFRFAGEHKVFSAGRDRMITALKGWNFRPLVCYDLRFPVWSMNMQSQGKFDYDCLIYIANWPEKRRDAWMSLLVARAIENQSYVIGMNRIGTDGKDIKYSGDSMVVHPKGNIMVHIPAHKDITEAVTLSYPELKAYREHFPVSLDWDKFTIQD